MKWHSVIVKSFQMLLTAVTISDFSNISPPQLVQEGIHTYSKEPHSQETSSSRVTSEISWSGGFGAHNLCLTMFAKTDTVK